MDEALVKEAEKYISGKQEPINKYDLAAFAEAHIEELRQSKKGKIVEHFEAYGQCRDSRRIAELEAQIEKMKCCGNCENGELSAHEEPCRHCQRCFASKDVTDQENIKDNWEAIKEIKEK